MTGKVTDNLAGNLAGNLVGHTPDFGLYIHWPFCLSKCPYCDFNSHVVSAVDEDKWQKALLSELSHMAELSDHSRYGRRPLTSIFVGGGTPSLMPVRLLGRLIEEAEKLFGFAPDIEITAEANPTSVETNKLQGFQSAGINRLSLGVQALDDDALGFLGRGHSAQEAITALETARTLFARLSVDLIYGRKDQTADHWRGELSKALSFGLDHLSLYQLTIEQGTQFYTRARAGEILSLNDDEMASLYEITEELTNAQNMDCYEVSNYAKDGGASRHNLTYWRTGDWIGIGPGAYGRLTMTDGAAYYRQETALRRSPTGWLEQALRDGHGIDKTARETGDTIIEEILMMGLRLAEGVPLSRITRLTGQSEWPFAPDTLTPFIEAGWLRFDNDHLSASFEGRIRLNYILQKLLA